MVSPFGCCLSSFASPRQADGAATATAATRASGDGSDAGNAAAFVPLIIELFLCWWWLVVAVVAFNLPTDDLVPLVTIGADLLLLKT